MTTTTTTRTRQDAIDALVSLTVAAGAGLPLLTDVTGDALYLTYPSAERAGLAATTAGQIRDDFRSPMVGDVAVAGGIVRIELRDPAAW